MRKRGAGEREGRERERQRHRVREYITSSCVICFVILGMGCRTVVCSLFWPRCHSLYIIILFLLLLLLLLFLLLFFFGGGGGQELLLLLFRFDWLKGGEQKGTSHYVVQSLPSLNLQLLMCQCLPNMC